MIEWGEATLPARIVVWFLLATGLSILQYRMITGVLDRASADPKRGPRIILSRYMMRMGTNLGMILVAFLLDGHTYVLLAVLAGLLTMTVAMAIRSWMVREG